MIHVEGSALALVFSHSIFEPYGSKEVPMDISKVTNELNKAFQKGVYIEDQIRSSDAQDTYNRATPFRFASTR